MNVDRLDALLQRFSVSARLFHSGPLCGVNDLAAVEGQGHLHVIRQGPVQVQQVGQPDFRIDEATLLFYPRPVAHRFLTDPDVGADMACATVEFNAGRDNPIAQALPPVLVVPLARDATLAATAQLLFDEASNLRCGRQASVNRLFEVLLIQLLRRVMDEGAVADGMLAGLAHPQLRKALVAMHEAPARDWTLESLAACAGMSRSRFANAFREVVAATPGDYLTAWRVSLAQDLLRRDRPLKQIALDVGYASPVALTRVFKARVGCTPREWRQRGAPPTGGTNRD